MTSVSRLTTTEGRRITARGRRLAELAGAVASISLLLAGMASTQASAGAPTATAARPGNWIRLGLSQNAPAAVWRAPDARDWIAWSSANGKYSLAIISPGGGFAVKPRIIIKGWSGVSFTPSLVALRGRPLLVFSGQGPGPRLSQGCIVGARPASPRWAIQSWTLSQNCAFANVGYGDATENSSGQLSAAWAGGLGVEYRLGTTPYPAKTADQQISIGLAHAESVAEANDQFGNGHTYASFYQFFSKNPSKDGVYVKDLTANGKVLKAPGTGTNTINFAPLRAAIARTSAHGGIYLAYCSNTAASGTPNCNTLLLWKAGAKKPIRIPHSQMAIGVAMSQGPAGRLWLSWYNEQANRVYVARTNKADNRFGPVESYSAPCIADGNTHPALSGGTYGRVDVAVECWAKGTAAQTLYLTQSFAGLTIQANPSSFRNTHAHTVTFTVTDAGDRVSGAKVKVNGKTKTTGQKGTVTFRFARHTTAGTYRATASLTNYFNGTTAVHVKN
jgi:hypothetical protein